MVKVRNNYFVRSNFKCQRGKFFLLIINFNNQQVIAVCAKQNENCDVYIKEGRI